jgi:DDE superfamily endonuclease
MDPYPRGRAGRGRGGQGRDDQGRGQRQMEQATHLGGNLPNYDCKDFLRLGLALVGFNDKRQLVTDELNQRRFIAFFGVGPKALASLFTDLEPPKDAAKFLMAVNWLKLYDTEHVLSGRWSMDEKTLRGIVKEYATRIQAMKETKVVWGGFDFDEIFIISVDGVHCRIQEVRKEPGAKWYSHKSNGPGLSYELGIAIKSNRLVWINGPFPASQHDITIFRGNDTPGLIDQIPNGKRAIGDSGYRGEPSKVAITRDGDSAEVKKYKARVKSRHETFNARLKGFGVLDQAFRHSLDQHKMAFEAVCILVQYDIENGRGLFEV